MASMRKPRRISTLDESIFSPGPVKINVEGAFIVDEENVSEKAPDDDGAQHDSRDIRLPHHEAVVSHVALDVRILRLRLILSQKNLSDYK